MTEDPTTDGAPERRQRCAAISLRRRPFAALVLPFVLALAACSEAEAPAVTSEPPAYEIGREVTVEGTVRENDRGCEADLDCRLHLEAADGPLEVVYAAPYPQPCPNHEATRTGFEVEADDRVRVFARVTGERELSTCPASRYSVTVLPPPDDPTRTPDD